jgi:hypothetical protein
MQENAAPPRVGRDLLVAHERAVLERVKNVTSTCVTSIVEGDRVAIHWVFEFVYQSGKTGRFDEVALQEWRGDRVFRERFFYDPSKPSTYCMMKLDLMATTRKVRSLSRLRGRAGWGCLSGETA